MIDYINLEKYCKYLTVLYVEDDAYSAKKTKELLDDIFPRVNLANNGLEALDLYNNYYKENNQYYNIIITDIRMPKMDGVKLVREIQNINLKQKIIVLSAHDETRYLMELINLGISQFILKPINYDNFIEILYKVTQDIYSTLNIKDNFESNELLLADNLVWDKKIKVLRETAKEIKLTKKEFLLLDLLLSVKEKTFTNEEILLKVWCDEDEKAPDITNLKNIISRFRKKVPNLNIENVYGYGYKINLATN